MNKKFGLFVVPLLATTFLVNCSNTIPKHVLHFEGTHCVLLDESKNPVTSDLECETGQVVSLFLVGETGYDIPKQDTVKITIKSSGKPYTDTWEYKAIDGSLSIKMTDNIIVKATSEKTVVHEVTEEEFKSAIMLEGVNYLQVQSVDRTSSSEPMRRLTYKCSPTVYYALNDDGSEELVNNIEDKIYKRATRTTEDELYTLENVDSSYFKKPQDEDVNLILAALNKESMFDYKKYKYDASTAIYSATLGETTFTYKLKFDDKKVVNLEVAGDEEGPYANITYKYNSSTPSFPKKWYLFNDWWNRCSSDDVNERATVSDIGKEMKITLNVEGDMVDHTVRLIGVDHKGTPHIPELKDKAEAHCTFEFKDLITKKTGALTTVWNSNTSIVLNNFSESDLNIYLNGTDGDIAGSIFSMLPSELQAENVIKEVKKEMGDRNSSDIDIATYDTKLFPLSYREITESTAADNYHAKEGATYAFYIGKKGDTDENRIKKAVNGEEGGQYWLRSPNTQFSAMAFTVNTNGYVGSVSVNNTYAVAPAFCI